MREQESVFSVIDEKTRAYKATLYHRFRQNLSYVVLFFVLAFTVIIPFATLGVVPFFSAAFVADTVYMTLCTYTAYLLFLPMGKTGGKEKSAAYFPTLSAWSALSDEVRARGELGAFAAYCKQRERAEAEAVRTARIESACMDVSEYTARYGGLGVREVRRVAAGNGVSRRMAWRLAFAARRVRVRGIEPARILCGAAHASVNDAGRTRLSYETRQIVKKPISCILLSLLLAGVVIYPTGSVGVGVLFTVVARVMGVLLSACSGFSVGINAVGAETEQMRMRILFLSSFRECVDKTE